MRLPKSFESIVSFEIFMICILYGKGECCATVKPIYGLRALPRSQCVQINSEEESFFCVCVFIM